MGAQLLDNGGRVGNEAQIDGGDARLASEIRIVANEPQAIAVEPGDDAKVRTQSAPC